MGGSKGLSSHLADTIPNHSRLHKLTLDNPPITNRPFRNALGGLLPRQAAGLSSRNPRSSQQQPSIQQKEVKSMAQPGECVNDVRSRAIRTFFSNDIGADCLMQSALFLSVPGHHIWYHLSQDTHQIIGILPDRTSPSIQVAYL
jgi:hypothetical protein